MMDISETYFPESTEAQRAKGVRLMLAMLLLFCISIALTALLFLGLPSITAKSEGAGPMHTSVQTSPAAKRVWSDS